MIEQIALAEDHWEDVFFDRCWTDGLPVRVPTRDRVDEFVARSGMSPDEVIGAVPPSRGIATVGNIAVNAFMAGCRPVHLKVVVAAVRALLQKKFDLYDVQCTTNPVTPLVIVNGPVRLECQVNCGRGCLGPGRYANGVIGRAVRLVLGNLGGAFDDKIDMATQGSPAKYSFCVGEAEEESPWEPLHVSLGYQPTDSVVTTAAVEGLIDIIPSYGNTQAYHLIDHFGRAMRTLGTSFYWSQGNPVLIVNPTHAEIFHDAGINRSELQRILFEEARIPVDSMPCGNIPVGDWTVVDGKVLGMRKAEDIYIVVAGQTGGHHTMYGMGFCLSEATSAVV